MSDERSKWSEIEKIIEEFKASEREVGLSAKELREIWSSTSAKASEFVPFLPLRDTPLPLRDATFTKLPAPEPEPLGDIHKAARAKPNTILTKAFNDGLHEYLEHESQWLIDALIESPKLAPKIISDFDKVEYADPRMVRLVATAINAERSHKRESDNIKAPAKINRTTTIISTLLGGGVVWELFLRPLFFD